MKLLLHYISRLWGKYTTDIHESCNWWQFCHEKWPPSIVSPSWTNDSLCVLHDNSVLSLCSSVRSSLQFSLSLSLRLSWKWMTVLPDCEKNGDPISQKATTDPAWDVCCISARENKETEREREGKTFYAMKEISRDLYPFFIAHANRFQMSPFYCSPRS